MEISQGHKKNVVCPPSVTTGQNIWAHVPESYISHGSQWSVAFHKGSNAQLWLTGGADIPLPGKHLFKKIVLDGGTGAPTNPPNPNDSGVRGGANCYYEGTDSYLRYALIGLYSCTVAGNSITCTVSVPL